MGERVTEKVGTGTAVHAPLEGMRMIRDCGGLEQRSLSPLFQFRYWNATCPMFVA